MVFSRWFFSMVFSSDQVPVALQRTIPRVRAGARRDAVPFAKERQPLRDGLVRQRVGHVDDELRERGRDHGDGRGHVRLSDAGG